MNKNIALILGAIVIAICYLLLTHETIMTVSSDSNCKIEARYDEENQVSYYLVGESVFTKEITRDTYNKIKNLLETGEPWEMRLSKTPLAFRWRFKNFVKDVESTSFKEEDTVTYKRLETIRQFTSN